MMEIFVLLLKLSCGGWGGTCGYYEAAIYATQVECEEENWRLWRKEGVIALCVRRPSNPEPPK